MVRFGEDGGILTTCTSPAIFTGQLAVSLFTRSGLGRDELARIWALSDMDRDSQLSQQEFIIAMHLITKRVGGDELPETTPASLVESASSSTKKKVRKSSSASPSAVPQSQPAGTQSATPVLMPAATSPSQQIASASAIGALQPELPYQLQPSSSALVRIRCQCPVVIAY
jgi:hypothetical protein